LSVFVTLFQAKTDECNVDLTKTPIQPTANRYKANGIEFEGAIRVGGLKLTAGATFTDAEITASSNRALIGTTPNRQADWVYQFASTYDLGVATLGASLVGNTDSKDNGPRGANSITLPGFAVVNAFVDYRLSQQATVNLGVNNLFDKLGFTESNDGRGAARAVNGRTARISIKYTF
jgi:outer membrane receptor protein involved in Fe transport